MLFDLIIIINSNKLLHHCWIETLYCLANNEQLRSNVSQIEKKEIKQAVCLWCYRAQVQMLYILSLWQNLAALRKIITAGWLCLTNISQGPKCQNTQKKYEVLARQLTRLPSNYKFRNEDYIKMKKKLSTQLSSEGKTILVISCQKQRRNVNSCGIL